MDKLLFNVVLGAKALKTLKIVWGVLWLSLDDASVLNDCGLLCFWEVAALRKDFDYTKSATHLACSDRHLLDYVAVEDLLRRFIRTTCLCHNRAGVDGPSLTEEAWFQLEASIQRAWSVVEAQDQVPDRLRVSTAGPAWSDNFDDLLERAILDAVRSHAQNCAIHEEIRISFELDKLGMHLGAAGALRQYWIVLFLKLIKSLLLLSLFDSDSHSHDDLWLCNETFNVAEVGWVLYFLVIQELPVI